MGAITRHVGHALDERELEDLTELCDRLRLGVNESSRHADATSNGELSYDV